MSSLRRIFEKLRLTSNSLFTSKRLIGTDLKGNRYYEEPRDNFPRRTVELNDGRSHYTDVCGAPLPVQWIAWMRHTRSNPPTHEELKESDSIRERTLERSRLIELENSKRKEEVTGRITKTSGDGDTPAPAPTPTKPRPTTRKEPDFQPDSWSPGAASRE